MSGGDGGPPWRIDRAGSRFEQLMSLLGMGPGEFEAVEANRFDASPKRWLDGKLAKLGYVRAQGMGHPPACLRACCKESR